MFSLVLFMVFVIFRADAVFPETASPFIATGMYFRRGSAIEDVIQESSKKALDSRSGSGTGETEITVIRLNYNYDTNEKFTVWKDEPLKIIIENAKARYIWCVNKYVIPGGPPIEYFVPQTELAKNIDITLNITKVKSEMNTRWGCTILQDYHSPSTPYTYQNHIYTAKDLYFNLYMKGARQVILTANNQTVMYDVKTNLSVEYSGIANYTYEDGEDVEFSCKKAQDQTQPSDTVRLEYFNAEGVRLFQGKPGTKFYKFRSVLNFTNDKYYLDCICNSNRTGPVRENRYRTIFYMKKDTEEHAIKLSINGQKLATFPNDTTTSIDEYIYKYIEGEILNIKCQEIHSFPKGTLYFNFDRNLIYKEDRREQEMGINTLRLLASNVNNKTLSCGINNTEIQKPTAKLLLLSDVPDNGIRIRGLPRTNVLYQYTNDIDQWTIEYQYSVNDKLSLTCVFKSGIQSPGHHTGLRNSPLFQWKFEGVISDSPANWTRALPAIKTSNNITMVLDKNHNRTKITCTYFPKSDINFNKTVEVIFRLKPKQSVFVREKNSEEVYTDKDSYVQMIVPIAASFGVAVAITTILCVICWHKRTKRLNLIENAYDNLSIENNSSIPAFPSQWESNYNDSHYTNIDEEVMQENYNYSTGEVGLNKMSFKRASNSSENHYTEIDDYFKPKPVGLTANRNGPEPTIYNNASALIGTASHNSNDAIYNNFQGNYDNLIHNNTSINKDNTNYSNLQSKGKSKSVTFRQMSNDWRPASKDGETNSRQDCRNNDQRWKQNNDGVYANIDQHIYMQPGDVQKKPYNENNFLKNKDSTNPSNYDYAEPYGDLGIRYNSDNKTKERKINFNK